MGGGMVLCAGAQRNEGRGDEENKRPSSPLQTKMAEVNEGLRLTADILSWNHLSF